MTADESGVTPIMTVGAVLTRSWSLLFRKPYLFFGLAVLPAIPPIIFLLFFPSIELTSSIPRFADLFLASTLEGAAAYGVYQALLGRKVGITLAVKRGLSHIIPIFIISLILTFWLLLPAISRAEHSTLGAEILSIGLFVVFVYLKCTWFVSVPVCAVEGTGVVASIRRSAELTKGRRWKIFGMYFLWYLVIFAFFMFFLFFLIPSLGVSSEHFGISQNMVFHLIWMVPRTLLTAFVNVAIAVTYYALRAEKEGVTVDQLANVFD